MDVLSFDIGPLVIIFSGSGFGFVSYFLPLKLSDEIA
jgi:hypothetical protein